MNKQSRISSILTWIIIFILPFIILMSAIRLMITPVYPAIEYRLPGFPADPFGFTLDDRLKFSKPSIAYLVNSEDISFLESLQFDNGKPIFVERELSHMADVKQLVTGMRFALAGGALILLITTFSLLKLDNRKGVLFAFVRGAWAEFYLIGGIIVFVLISFDFLFTKFHQLFFENGTWMFYTTDTLIRLFPMRFWRDAFFGVGLLSIIIALTIIFLCKNQLKKLHK